MSRSAQKQIVPAKQIKNPNSYIRAVYTEYKDWVLEEPEAKIYKGKWASLFNANSSSLDLEIGPGAGHCFARRCLEKQKSCFLAIELKYKPLIQTIRRVRKNKSLNAKVIRYNAALIENLFAEKELSHVYIHFPDPWLKKRKSKKHQLIQDDFCRSLYKIQKPNCFLDFKTDSLDYFEQSLSRFLKAGYKLDGWSRDLYRDQEPVIKNLSQFERIFVQKKIPIKYAVLRV